VYLFYRLNDHAGLRVARLTSDGLRIIVDDKFSNLEISNTSYPVDSSWHFARGNLDYLIFSEALGGEGIQVARSSNGILGPYERSNQTLISGYKLKKPNLIIENEDYHLIFGSTTEEVFLVSLKWDSDWPYAVNFSFISAEKLPALTPV